MRMKKFFLKTIITAMALVVALLGACNVIDYTNYYEYESGQPSTQKIVTQELADSYALSANFNITTPRESGEQPMSIKQAVKKVLRSAVCLYIFTEGSSTYGCGSGTIVNIDLGEGDNVFYILTCHHVIDKEGSTIYVKVADADGNYSGVNVKNDIFTYSGIIGGSANQNNAVRLIGGDKYSDVAVLKLVIDKSGAQQAAKTALVAALNEAKADIIDYEQYPLEKGEEVFAIGNSLGELPGHLSSGIISHLSRETTVESVGGMTLLEIDVNSYHGNSGGGLYNLYGELVGITNSGDDDYPGINYAIAPSTSSSSRKDKGFVEVAKNLIKTKGNYLNNFGYVSGRFLLFGFTLAQQNGCVMVYNIDKSGNGYKAGLRGGDIIMKVLFNGETYNITEMKDYEDLMEEIGMLDEFTLVVKKTSTSLETTQIKLQRTQYYFCNTGDYTTVTD